MDKKGDIKKFITENFYEHKDMKKYLPKYNDEQLKLTGIPLTKHILMCGGTGSGKSNTLCDFLKKTMSDVKKPSYETIHMLIRKFEPINYFLQEKLDGYIKFYTKVEEFPDVNQFQDLDNKNKKMHLIVFDDFITEKNTKNIKKIQDYLIYGRAKGCQVILLSQSYFQTDILLRKQLSFVLLCGISGKRDLQSILREYSMEDINPHQLQKMYDYAKTAYASEPTFLKINTNTCPKDKKFSKYWLMYLNPDNF